VKAAQFHRQAISPHPHTGRQSEIPIRASPLSVDLRGDPLDANEHLDFDADERVCLPAAEMLRQLGFGTVHLVTNNPDKVAGAARLPVERPQRAQPAHQGDAQRSPALTCARLEIPG
jgi:hypothetical protein